MYIITSSIIGSSPCIYSLGILKRRKNVKVYILYYYRENILYRVKRPRQVMGGHVYMLLYVILCLVGCIYIEKRTSNPIGMMNRTQVC